MTKASARSRRGGVRRLQLEGRYGVLLLTLIASYVASAFSAHKIAEPLQVVFFAGVVLLALRTSPLGRRRVRLIGAAVVTGSLGAVLAALGGTGTGYGVADVWKALMLLLAAVLIVRRVLARPAVTVQSIYGALSAYLIIGLMFAAIYAAMEHLGGAPFFASGETANTQTFQYFSFTTLTTLGYGDFTAAGDGGRAIAVIEALVGQVFLATLVARLVAAFRAPAEQPWVRAPKPRPLRAPRRGGGVAYRRIPPVTPARASPNHAGRRGGAGRLSGAARDRAMPPGG